MKFFLILIVGLYVYEKCNARTPLLLLVLTCFMYVIMKNIKQYIFLIKGQVSIDIYGYLYFQCVQLLVFLLAAFYSKKQWDNAIIRCNF